MSSNSDAAAATFDGGFNCAQAVLATFGPQFGLDRTLALRVAQGFGGGMGGQMGETCGAVTGAFMVLGLQSAKTGPGEDAAKQENCRLVNEFARRFRERHGSLLCRDLLGCDISTPEGMRQAREQGLFKSRCPDFVRTAAEILDDLAAAGHGPGPA